MYCEITNGIKIEVEPTFIPDQSNPKLNQYYFSYRIKITNQSETVTQLLSRHWVITDGNGATQEVKGPGVIGQQPVLEPGQSFEYSSFCPLSTPTGNMRGSFQMIDQNKKEQYDVKVPLFFLRDLRNFH